MVVERGGIAVAPYPSSSMGGVHMAHIVNLIYTETHRGSGTEEDPFRSIPQLWTPSGVLVAQTDSVNSGNTLVDLSRCFNVPPPSL